MKTNLKDKLKEAISIYQSKTAVFQSLQHELFQMAGSIKTLQELLDAEDDTAEGETEE